MILEKKGVPPEATCVDSVILMGKNTLIRRCIKFHAEKTENNAYLNLLPLLVGNVGLIFTKGDLKEVSEKVAEYKVGFDVLYFSRIDYQDREKRKDLKTLEGIWRGSRSLGSSADIFTGIFPKNYEPPSGNFYFEVDDTAPIVQTGKVRNENAEDMSVLQSISIVLDRHPELRQEGLAYEILQWYICKMEAWFAVDVDTISLKNWDQSFNRIKDANLQLTVSDNRIKDANLQLTVSDSRALVEDPIRLPDHHRKAELLELDGNTYFKKDRLGASIDAYTEAIALCPYVAVYWTNRALCFQKRKEWAKVEDDCRKAIELDSNSVKVMKYVAKVCCVVV